MSTSAPALGVRLAGLAEAVEAADGRCEADIVDAARAVVRRAGERVAFSGDYTVIALAGATGSGKSSLFNAITQTGLAQVAVRRPTTSRAMAVAWGATLPNDLLDWLDVPRRHLIADSGRFSQLVLIDLPDHDSTETAHRVTVDRLVPLVDGLIWVVDPQKYADAALHDRYLKPLAQYDDVMMVVLNQADRLAPAALADCVSDLRRLLTSEGLKATPVMPVSALQGTGVGELRDMLANIVATKRASLKRLSTDVEVVAASLAGELGDVRPSRLGKGAREQLVTALGDAAGVPVVVDGVRRAWVKRGSSATGWPFVIWLTKFRPDPLKRLRLDLGPKQHSPTETNRTSLPRAGAVQRAHTERALRGITEAASEGLPAGWVAAVRRAAIVHQDRLGDRLDEAIASTDLKTAEGTWWWTIFRVLQWILTLAVVAGIGWLFSGPVLAWLGLPQLPALTWNSVPLPTWLLLGGVVGGVLLAVLGRALVGLGASWKARAAEKSLREAIRGVASREILEPVQDELDRHGRAIAGVRVALHGR